MPSFISASGKRAASARPAAPKKLKWYQFIAKRRARRIAAQQKIVTNLGAKLLEQTRERDRLIEAIRIKIPGPTLVPGRNVDPNFEMRLHAARGMALSNPKVLNAQFKINQILMELQKKTGMRSSSPGALRKMLGPDFRVDGLGFAGRFKGLGELDYQDLGIYQAKKK